MLNYIWLALLLLGIGTALTIDIIDASANTYRNGDPLKVTLQFDNSFVSEADGKQDVKVISSSSNFTSFYSLDKKDSLNQPAQITYAPKKKRYSLFIRTTDDTPAIWKEMAKISGDEDDLLGYAEITNVVDSNTVTANIYTEKISFGKMREVTNAALDYAGTSVKIALGLIGIMALWLGIMKIAEDAGLINIIAKAVKPVTKFLFPDVPHDHPAIGAIIMNLSANMLGLGNAATPFGLKAMEELDKLNPEKGTATNAMCTFLAVNTAGLTLIPATAIAVRAAAGSNDPAIIIGTSFFGALCATTTGIIAAKVLERFTMPAELRKKSVKTNSKGLWVFLGIVSFLIILFVSGLFSSIFGSVDQEVFKNIIQIFSTIAIPLIIGIFVLYGVVKKVKIYEAFVEGAKEGFNIAIRIIPYLVAMLVAIGIFRAGGAMEFLIHLLNPLTQLIGMPAEALPMALMRPLSGSGALGIMAEIISVHGPDSFIGILVSTIMGSTETTFYVLAVYFGAVGINKTRHALAAGLLADAAGILGALFIVRLLFG